MWLLDALLMLPSAQRNPGPAYFTRLGFPKETRAERRKREEHFEAERKEATEQFRATRETAEALHVYLKEGTVPVARSLDDFLAEVGWSPYDLLRAAGTLRPTLLRQSERYQNRFQKAIQMVSERIRQDKAERIAAREARKANKNPRRAYSKADRRLTREAIAEGLEWQEEPRKKGRGKMTVEEVPVYVRLRAAPADDTFEDLCGQPRTRTFKNPGLRGGFVGSERGKLPAWYFLDSSNRKWPVGDPRRGRSDVAHAKIAIQYMSRGFGRRRAYPELIERLADRYPPSAQYRSIWSKYERLRPKIEEIAGVAMPSVAELRMVA